MYKIKAEVRYIPRVHERPPVDGVHVAGKEGWIKGVHSLWFNDRLTPKGATSFYWRLDENTGLRIGYSFGWFKALRGRLVERDWTIMRKAYKHGISPKPYDLVLVMLDLHYKDNSRERRIKTEAFAIKVQHVHYPEEAWENYAKGHPYSWSADAHPDHNPDGFIRFRESIRPIVNSLGLDTSLKLGDIIWCCRNKRYYLVDTGL